MHSNVHSWSLKPSSCRFKHKSNHLVMICCHLSSHELPPFVFTLICAVHTQVHLSCTCTPSLLHHTFILSVLLSLPRADCSSSPSPAFPLLLCLLLLLVSVIYRRRCAVHTHSTSDTTPTPPSATGLSYLYTVVYLRDPMMQRRRRGS